MPVPAEAAAASSPGGVAGDDLLSLFAQERETTTALMGEWMAHQRKMNEEHMSQQERLFKTMLEAHRLTLQSIMTGGRTVGPRPDRVAVPDVAGDSIQASPREDAVGEAAKAQSGEPKAAEKTEEEEPPHLTDEMEELNKHEEVLSWWRRTSGMQSVEKWVKNYRKHPAGWAALLMIHGIPEVTGRLRSKVENYAIYSALFLSMSIALLTDPPNVISAECPDDDLANLDWWLCHGRRRIYLYGFGVGTAAHMLSILLAMSFVNALNETARDSDVYRMFSRGKGFIATVRCQYAFRLGCVADFISVVVALTYVIGWEAIIGAVISTYIIVTKLRETSALLFSSCSIVKYWRDDLGGNPDKDDPYDLQIPVGVFADVANTNHKYFCAQEPLAEGGTAAAREKLWESCKEALQPDVVRNPKLPHPTEQPAPSRKQIHTAAVAALF